MFKIELFGRKKACKIVLEEIRVLLNDLLKGEKKENVGLGDYITFSIKLGQIIALVEVMRKFANKTTLLLLIPEIKKLKEILPAEIDTETLMELIKED